MAVLHFRSVGQGTPILVIHGWTIDSTAELSDLEPIFVQRPGYRRLYVDLPGHGSTPIDGVKNLDEMLDRVTRFIEHEILPKKFLVAGSSCGAYFARAVVYRFQEDVVGLMLRVPHVGLKDSERDIDPVQLVVVNSAALDQVYIPLASGEDLKSTSVQTTDYLTATLGRYQNLIAPAIAAADTKPLAKIRDDATSYVLTCPFHTPQVPFVKPSLIVAGRQDDVVGYRDGWSLLPSYPRATHIVMDRAGHGLPVDEIEARLFRTLVEDWLDRVKETDMHH
ncbi:hypothetical protein LTR78_006080 [Recurvomyces mirabilis]|uniref:AB hydrolase-1 domain-containing protein n=1 Tax=Recurvomyces mirabilis TaxID=574656 RepID=A0AAE0WLE5_9PEZI|nr:hypothetical protein LTR78_006080 [Recurvomyces mirabilis]KAK5151922.1 hypothetical protein LTS14_008696 [Recurvomyces mirabilis]